MATATGVAGDMGQALHGVFCRPVAITTGARRVLEMPISTRILVSAAVGTGIEDGGGRTCHAAPDGNESA